MMVAPTKLSVSTVTLGILVLTLLASCTEYTPFPRKYGYHRIAVPEAEARAYQTFSNDVCPFSFEYPSYGVVTRNSTDSCWVDIHMPRYDLTWHITYRDIPGSGKSRSDHFEEYRSLIFKHAKKATRIQPHPIAGPTGAGVRFEIDGNVGTPAQIFYHDSSDTHVMMMSFYFQTALKNDSLAPVITYMKEEVNHMVASLRWE